MTAHNLTAAEREEILRMSYAGGYSQEKADRYVATVESILAARAAEHDAEVAAVAAHWKGCYEATKTALETTAKKLQQAEADLASLQAAVEACAAKWRHPGLIDDPDENAYDDLRAALTDTRALQERLAQAKREALREAADALGSIEAGKEWKHGELWVRAHERCADWLRARAEAGETP